ncbi:hypothetical protein TH53_07795 [Pedobacter lusitanus]|uniref:Contig29, whole genome shotgun sequence n=1 Tax=Pedobacter lusitanus TaxID=1503925 RepID=A0A0D0F844_9SPHI|nr:anthrone oxygenase family protein [Pedobacter lusitanus]KIO77808.1 hypothetical protein TH53_07795 [Pedobacter lusitanus]
MSLNNLTQITAILLTGLIAGLLYGYDCSVIRGLGALQNKNFLTAFQSINKEILNPYFFISFMGTLLLLPLATWLNYHSGGLSNTFYFLLAATLIYAIAVFGVTIFGNVPLNNTLSQFDIEKASPAELMSMRHHFEASWNALHHIRTYAAILAFLAAILSLLKNS